MLCICLQNLKQKYGSPRAEFVANALLKPTWSILSVFPSVVTGHVNRLVLAWSLRFLIIISQLCLEQKFLTLLTAVVATSCSCGAHLLKATHLISPWPHGTGFAPHSSNGLDGIIPDIAEYNFYQNLDCILTTFSPWLCFTFHRHIKCSCTCTLLQWVQPRSCSDQLGRTCQCRTGCFWWLDPSWDLCIC